MDETSFRAALRFLTSSPDPAYDALRSAKSIGEFPFTYLAPLRMSDIPDGSVDFVVSRTVLEHIPRQALRALLIELRSKLTAGAIMIHHIDHSDHLEHHDKSISKLNFLTWSPRKHAIVNWLTKEGENRLRHHEYRAVFEEAGYRVVHAQVQLHQPTRAIVGQLRLTKPFSDMPPDQLAVLNSLYVLAPQTLNTDA
jgi:hypothetical protein